MKSTIIKKGQLAALRSKQASMARPEAAGVARAEFVKARDALDAWDVALVMNFGSEAVALDQKGDEVMVVSGTETYTIEVVNDAGDAEEKEETRSKYEKMDARSSTRGWKVELSDVVPAGSAPTNKMIGDTRIPCGVVLVVGGASTAKTPMVHALAEASVEEYCVVRYGEPLSGYITDPRDAALALGHAMMHYSDIVFDSVKDLLAFAPGGAMSSGLSRGALPVLSDLSALAATAGCTIYVPLNPSTPAADIVEMVVEAAKSNVSMVLVTETVVVESGEASWLGLSRMGEGLQREVSRLKTWFDSDSVLQIGHVKGKSARPRASTNSTVTTAASLGNNEVDALLRRSLI